jgi:hypothetical protein
VRLSRWSGLSCEAGFSQTARRRNEIKVERATIFPARPFGP